jgi:translation initiation factor 3 subunit D
VGCKLSFSDFQFSGGVDWRSKLDSQRGAVLATELKNNSCKIAKWTASAILAGSDILKFGFVSYFLNFSLVKV